MPALRCCLPGLLLLVLTATGLAAQRVEGRLLDADSGEPVVGGIVILDTGEGNAVQHVLSDASGYFDLRVRRPGTYLLRALRVGYGTAEGGPFALAAGETLEVDFMLEAQPTALEEVTVVAERRVRRLERGGFYFRQRMGFGRFLTREQIERRRPIHFTDLLRGLPGVRLVPAGTGWEVMMRGTSSARGNCIPSIIMNGMLLRSAQVVSSPNSLAQLDQSFGLVGLDDFFPTTEWIEAIEVYASSHGLPAQYTGMMSPCGAILIWTR
jgi:hypothetical protein